MCNWRGSYDLPPHPTEKDKVGRKRKRTKEDWDAMREYMLDRASKIRRDHTEAIADGRERSNSHS